MVSNNDSPDHGDMGDLPIESQISQAVRVGLPLESGLRALAEQTSSRSDRQALLALSADLEQGTPLAEAMQKSGARLPRSMSALVAAGMESGCLDTVMQYSVEQSQRTTWLSQQIWTALAYPLALLWFGTSICLGILLAIIPQFKSIFLDFGTEIPGLTLAIVWMSDAVGTVGWVTILIVMSLLALALIPLLVLGQTRIGRGWAASIPVLGMVFRLATLSDFCQILAVLLESRLPFPKALRFAASASDNPWLIRKCNRLSRLLEDGDTPDQAARLVGLPNSLSQVFRHASSDQTVIHALRGLSELFAARCSVSSRLIKTVFEPFAVITVVGFAGLTAIAVFLPLIKLLNDLS